jgi:hypothetical protein
MAMIMSRLFVGYFAWSCESVLSSVHYAVRLLHGLGPRLCGFGVLGILSIECIGWLLRRSEAVEVDEIAVSMKAQAFGNCCTPFIFVMMAALQRSR